MTSALGWGVRRGQVLRFVRHPNRGLAIHINGQVGGRQGTERSGYLRHPAPACMLDQDAASPSLPP